MEDGVSHGVPQGRYKRTQSEDGTEYRKYRTGGTVSSSVEGSIK
jgi:hypothetical protein